tara:strand:+ start:211 stop:801 length:591 start_codon:yes stop_codon:yes gene_type:complete
MQFFNLFIILLLFISYPKAQYDAVSIGMQSADQNLLHSATFYKGDLFSGLDAARMKIDVDDDGLSVNLLMPRFGYRMPFKESGKLTSYNQVETYLLLPFISTSGSVVIDSDSEKDLRDALSLMGLKASHSIQYNFNKQLALVADVGFNMIIWDIDTDIEEEVCCDIWGDTMYQTTTSELSLNLGYTYSKLSLLFSF